MYFERIQSSIHNLWGLPLVAMLVCAIPKLAAAPPAAPGFIDAPIFRVSSLAVGIVVADFTGDGHQDVAVSGGTLPGTIDLLVGNGNGSFAPAVERVVSSYLRGIAAGDFNGDERPDIVVSDGGAGGFDILLNRGGGDFDAPVHIAAGTDPQSIAVGDFNRDGHLDVVLADGQGGLIVVLGHGDGTFGPPKAVASGTKFLHFAVADVNRDGRLDLVANTETTIEVFLGSGAGNFGAAHLQTLASGKIASFGLGDFNGDGKVDLIAGLDKPSYSNQVVWLAGHGDGTFAAPGQAFPAGPGVPVFVGVGDFNRDGNLDVMLASNETNNGSGGSSVNVLSGNGNGTFRPATLYGVGVGPSAIAFGSFNSDGRMDAVALTGAGVSLLLSNAAGGFQAALEYECLGASTIMAGDVNGDKNVDLVAVISRSPPNQGFSVLLGNGKGAFELQPEFRTDLIPYSGLLANFNSDKTPDLAIYDYDRQGFATYLGSGNGTFSHSGTFTVGGYVFYMVNADLNGDGIQDLVATSFSGGGVDSAVKVMLGTGGGRFKPPVSYSMGTANNPGSIAIADFNRDGHLDLAVSNAVGNVITILHGRGDGTFVNAGNIPTLVDPAYVRAADLDLDGAPDLVVANYNSSSISVYMNNGAGVFLPRVNYNVSRYPAFITAKDLNGDGIPDLAVGTTYGVISVLLGSGKGSFTNRQDYFTGSSIANFTLADFNHDGLLDIATAVTGTVRVLLNSPR